MEVTSSACSCPRNSGSGRWLQVVGLRIGGSACPLGWREVGLLEADGVEGNSKEQEVEIPASQGHPRPRDPQGGSGGLDSLTDSSAWSPVSATPSSSSSSYLSKGLMSGLSEKVPRECILSHRDQRQSSESAHSYHVRVVDVCYEHFLVTSF